MNMAEYVGQRLQQPANVNFEPIIRGLRSDILDWDQVKNPYHICKIQLQKKKSGVKKWMEISAIKGGVWHVIANAGKKIHFVGTFPLAETLSYLYCWIISQHLQSVLTNPIFFVPFPFPTIPRNNSLWFPFLNFGNVFFSKPQKSFPLNPDPTPLRKCFVKYIFSKWWRVTDT